MSKEDYQRELYMNMSSSLQKFKKDLTEYIHHAEYPITYLSRGISGRISTAEMYVEGGIRIYFRADEWNVVMPAEGNPVNMDLLEQWEKHGLDKEINYHKSQLEILMKRKQELK